MIEKTQRATRVTRDRLAAVRATPVAVGAPEEACLTENQIIVYLDGGDPGIPVETLLSHLDGCDTCRRLLTEASRVAHPSDAARVSGAVGVRTMRTLAEGDRIIGRYEIRRFLARGGMGEVYEAHDTLLKERVALKTLALTSLDDERAMRRFMAEVRLARKVTHRNVCRILEFGIHEKTLAGGAVERVPFLTMEFLQGETLGQRVARQGGLPIDEALPVVRQMVEGLAAVHAAGIVHRDFKSDNVFLVPDGEGERVVIMDFGLARSLEQPSVSITSPNGVFAGTADYMAPEQIEGKPPTPAFDVFALGVVLFEVLTGQRPFAKLTPLARLKARPPAPSVLEANVPPRWDRAVLRCLKRDPARRFRRVEEVAAALAPPRLVWRAALATLAAGVGALGAWWVLR